MSRIVDSHSPPPPADPQTHSEEVERPPRPTVAPAALAIGIMLVPWGILTHWSMNLAGLCLMTWAIGKWIHELRKEWAASD